MRHLDSLCTVTKCQKALNTNLVVLLHDPVTVIEEEAADLLSEFQCSA